MNYYKQKKTQNSAKMSSLGNTIKIKITFLRKVAHFFQNILEENILKKAQSSPKTSSLGNTIIQK